MSEVNGNGMQIWEELREHRREFREHLASDIDEFRKIREQLGSLKIQLAIICLAATIGGHALGDVVIKALQMAAK